MCCVFWYSFFSPFQTYIRHPGYKGKKGGRGIHMCCVFWYSFFSPFQTHQTSGLKMEIGKQGGVGGVIYLHINIKFPTFFSSFQFWGLASQNGRTRQGFSHFGFSRVNSLVIIVKIGFLSDFQPSLYWSQPGQFCLKRSCFKLQSAIGTYFCSFVR